MAGPSSRMLALLSLLQVHREWTGDELAGRLTVSPRTLRRDVDRLRELGYRIDSVRGPAGGYRLAAGSDLPPLLFDDDQAVAIALALAVAPASGADIAESAVRALATVRQVMPDRLRQRVDLVDAVVGSSGPRVDPDVLVAVSEAVHRREVLRFGYGERDTPHRVEPHAVVAGTAGGTCWPGTPSTRTGARTASTGSPRGCAPGCRSRRDPYPARTRRRSCRPGSRAPTTTTRGRAGAPSHSALPTPRGSSRSCPRTPCSARRRTGDGR